MGWVLRPAKATFEAPTLWVSGEGNTVRDAWAKPRRRPRSGLTPRHTQTLLTGNWEVFRSTVATAAARIGEAQAVADDARTEEVRPAGSTCEAGEQGGASRGGIGGGKQWDQEECEPASHGPDVVLEARVCDTTPGRRVTGAGPHT